MPSVVITGANGFIGRKLAEHFKSKNYDVYCLVHSSITPELKECNIIRFELDDIKAIEKKLPKNVNFFYHLAWEGVNSDFKDDYLIQSKNIDTSFQILKLAEKIKCKKVIFTGSVSEYAYAEEMVDGSNEPSPCDMYSACKVSTHFICDLYAKKNNLNFFWVLIPSIYGPGRNDSNLITYSIKTFLKGEKPSFTKLEQRWDYVHIDDLIVGLYLIAEKGVLGNTYVIGGGNNHKLSYYVKLIRDYINPKLDMGIGELPYKNDKIDNSLTDFSLTTKDTGYIPSHKFEDAIKDTIDYFRNYTSNRK